jgi:nitroimidazol reductase NimA-like FMN-containing flavoprotein (pyridoxamine 5'-phosphate oxidase superfamily)
MTMPVTTLDQRFSDPAATAISWAETSKALESAGVFWISTVRADGRPHVTPLVAVWVDSVLYFCTGEAEQKAINLSASPHVVLTTGCNSWDSGLDVMVEGDAVRVTDDAALSRLAQAWTTKWDGQWHYEVRSGAFHHPGGDQPVLVFGVAPAKVLAFTKGTFSHTRHVF